MRTDHASAAWIFSGARSSATLRGDWRREDHRTQTDLNHSETRGEVQVGRVLGPRVSIDLRGSYSRNKYALVDVRFNEWEAGAGATWRGTQTFSVSLRASHLTGSGDTSRGPGTRDYTENRGELRLVYTPRF
jgi:hypothetical protein